MNENKSPLLVFRNNDDEVSVKIYGSMLKKLDLKNHVNSLCKKVSQTLHVLVRVFRYMKKPQLKPQKNDLFR